ncbi:MAG: VOC family protein [Cyclobacteriaceae bacterium]|nr:VOC family protein [Cyclobacteriaceae bacterium]
MISNVGVLSGAINHVVRRGYNPFQLYRIDDLCRMNRIISYLTFNGNCYEAMHFYQKCFGGELDFQLVGESPPGKNLPDAFQRYVLQGALRNGSLELIGTDMVGNDGLMQGNTVSLLVFCKSKREVHKYFKLLATGGRIVQPVKKNFWGLWFGTLQDRYGTHWHLQSV